MEARCLCLGLKKAKKMSFWVRKSVGLALAESSCGDTVRGGGVEISIS